MLDGPAWVAINGLETYTVTVTDENGEVPALASASDQKADGGCVVTIVAETSVPDRPVRTTGLEPGNCLVLNQNTGMGEFRVVAPFGAQQGDSVRITALLGDEAIVRTIMLGDDPTPPATHESLVTASDAAAGTATIMWQPITGATSYHVAVITDDGNYTLVSGTYMEITDVSDREHMFTGLTSGTAYIFAVIGEMADGTYSGLAFERMTLE